MHAVRALAASTAFRWTCAIAGGFTAMALFLFAFIYWQAAGYEQGRIDGIVIREARAIANAPAAEAGVRLEAWLAADPHGVRYGGLFGADGSRLGGNLVSVPGDLPPDGTTHQAVLGQIDRDRDGDEPEVVRGVAQHLEAGRLLVIGYDIDELDQVRDVVLHALWLGLGPMVVLAFGGGTLLTRRSQRRIAAVHLAVGRIMQGNLRERLPVRGAADDLDKVAVTVNQMLDDIERLVGEIRAVGDNIAHDLRTPLTRVRTRLERSREEARTREEFQAAADRAIAAVDQALAVVTALLRIGEIEHGRRMEAFAPVDLADVLRDAADLYEPLAEDKGAVLRLTLGPAGLVLGDRDLLLEAVGNLMDNAIKFAPPGTEVHLALYAGSRGPCVRVADQGPGILPAERERVLQRFYRSERSRTVSGSGLGLSLVAAIVALHGFRLHIGGANPGCTVEISCAAPAAWPENEGVLPSRCGAALDGKT